jgi:hypothetical protein
LSKKKSKKFGNPAAEAERRKRAAEERLLQSDQAATEPVHTPSDGSGVSIEQYQQLLQVCRKIEEQSVDLAADFNRVLQAYALLVTNSFKLSATMDEFDVNNPKSIERLKSKLAFFIEDLPRNCEKAGIRMPEIKGLDYVAALNVQVMNADEYSPTDLLVIDEVVEPLLVYEPKNSGVESTTVGGLLKAGLVTVKRKGE